MKKLFLLVAIFLVSAYTKSYEIIIINKSAFEVQVAFDDSILLIISPDEISYADFDFPVSNVRVNDRNYRGHGYGDVTYTIKENGDLKITKSINY